MLATRRAARGEYCGRSPIARRARHRAGATRARASLSYNTKSPRQQAARRASRAAAVSRSTMFASLISWRSPPTCKRARTRASQRTRRRAPPPLRLPPPGAGARRSAQRGDGQRKATARSRCRRLGARSSHLSRISGAGRSSARRRRCGARGSSCAGRAGTRDAASRAAVARRSNSPASSPSITCRSLRGAPLVLVVARARARRRLAGGRAQQEGAGRRGSPRGRPRRPPPDAHTKRPASSAHVHLHVERERAHLPRARLVRAGRRRRRAAARATSPPTATTAARPRRPPPRPGRRVVPAAPGGPGPGLARRGGTKLERLRARRVVPSAASDESPSDPSSTLSTTSPRARGHGGGTVWAN